MSFSCVYKHASCGNLGGRLPERLAQWTCQLLAAELCFNTDPYTLAAILDRETAGGTAKQLDTPGPGGRGDKDAAGIWHGHGLVQIDDRSHHGFVRASFDDGLPLWADPSFNILYAARLLRKNLDAARGELVVAIAAYNCGLRRALRAIEHMTRPLDEVAAIPFLDAVTTDKYVSWVLKRRSTFLREAVFATLESG